mmetsp:Transcript_34465/g.75434  ORF Transcript_34465/g.75434 Transcript_34465/m.75434 type:complete len:529 (-) Transcript_34465:130-1716(-)
MSAWGKNSALRSCDALLSRVEENDATLVDLVILPIKSFGDDDVVRLASAIQSNNNNSGGNLRTISASGHAVSPHSLGLLGSAIGSCSRDLTHSNYIISLSIGDQTMGDEGIIALCDGIMSTSTNGGAKLESLDLTFKNASHGAMKAVAKCFADSPSLHRLDLSRNERIGDDGVEVLCDASASVIGGGTAFRALSQLNLSQCSVGPTGTQALASLLLAPSKVQEEHAGTTKNEDKANRCRLELVMNSNSLGRAGCTAVGSLLNAPTFGVGGCSVLSALSLVDCAIDDDDVSALIEAARGGGCTGLVTLDLSRNLITQKGVMVLSNALAVRAGRFSNGEGNNRVGATSLRTLKELRVAGNDMGADGVVNLTHALVQRQRTQDKEAQQQPSSGNCTLSILDLCDTNCGVEGAVAALKCGGLSSLRLFGNRIGSAGLEAITPLLRGGHPSLVELDIGGNDAKEPAVEKLIREISVPDNDYISTLRVLELGGNEGGELVEAALKDLRHVKPELDVARDKPKTTSDAAQGWENA